MKLVRSALILTGIIMMISGATVAKGEDAVVADGKEVSFEYTLTVDGKVMDSSKSHGPMKYTHGKGQIIPGLSKELTGMKVGEEKTVIVKPEDAYGVADPSAFKEIPRSSLPPNVEPKVGMLLRATNAKGQNMPVKITEIKKDSLIVDLNHPLAGKTLDFQVKIVSIQ